MDHQGGGGTRLPAGAGRRGPWQSPPGRAQYDAPEYGESPYDPNEDAEYGDPAAYGPRPGSGPMPTTQAPTGAYATGGARGTGAYAAGANGTGGYGAGGYSAGPRPTGGPGSGAQPAPGLGPGSGAQPVLGAASGPQRALDRDPARGFPPRGAQQEHAADSWYSSPAGYAPTISHAPPAPSYAPPAPPPAPSYAPPAPPPAPSYAPPAPPPADDYSAPTGSFPAPADDYAQYSPPGGAHYDYAPDDEPRPASDRGPGRRLLRRPAAIGLVVVLVLAGLGAAGYKFIYQPRSATATANADRSLKLPTNDSTAGNPYFSKKLGQWQHINTRKQDPAPLTLGELYLPAFTLAGSEYLKATASITKTCGNAVFGDLIQAALQVGGCSQVARASYVSGNGKIMGTIGVANLSSAYWAEKATKAASATELVAPLTTDKGPTKKLLTGTGVAYAEAKGHYLILLYAEFTSIKTPTTAAEKQELVDFCDGMFTGSADIALSHRLLYGKP
jgi:hypothetical protein